MSNPKISTPGDYADFLNYLDSVTTEEALFSRLTYWFAFRTSTEDAQSRPYLVEARAKELKLWNGLELKVQRWEKANKDELDRIGIDAFGALVGADYAAYRDGTQPQQSKPQQLQPFTSKQLSEMTLPPIRYVVDDVIPMGMGLLVAKPKIGKSWMVLDLCLSVAAVLNIPREQIGEFFFEPLTTSKKVG